MLRRSVLSTASIPRRPQRAVSSSCGWIVPCCAVRAYHAGGDAGHHHHPPQAGHHYHAPPSAAASHHHGHSGHTLQYPYANNTAAQPHGYHHHAPYPGQGSAPEDTSSNEGHQRSDGNKSDPWAMKGLLATGFLWAVAIATYDLLLSSTTALGNCIARGDRPLIVASGDMWDPTFRDSVVMIFESGPLRGANGLILNKPAMGNAVKKENTGLYGDNKPSGPVLRGRDLPSGQSWLVSHALANNPVFVGGPLALDEANPVVLHGVPGVPGADETLPGVYLGGDHRVLRRKLDEGACAADDMMIVIGYSGWGIAQLQREMRSGSWAAAVLETGATSGGSRSKLPTSPSQQQSTMSLARRLNSAVNEFCEATGESSPVRQGHLERGLAALVTEAMMRDMRPPADVGPEEAEAIAEQRAAMMGKHAGSPLFGRDQKAVAAKVWESMNAAAAGDSVRRAPFNDVRPTRASDYVPTMPTLKLPASLRWDSTRSE